jgi:flagellar motility protein MotE (MotC chaperone)
MAVLRYTAGTGGRIIDPVDYDHLIGLRSNHPAWRLLNAGHAPLVIGFLHRAFIAPNMRSASEQELAAQLDDYLHHLRERLGDGEFPRRAKEYLSDWAEDSRGWLRRYYPADSDEPHFDLTPACEQAIQWLAGLEQRQFVGAESRIRMVFDLLRDIAHGTESDPEARIAELERRREAIDEAIEGVRAGRLILMEPTQLRERVLQAADTARALLADFRQVEQNFRDLDRQVRERIATWDGSKGEILDEVFGESDVIAKSDQGRSFRAFWDFLMSPARQDELTALLDRILAMEPVAALEIDPRLRRIHHDWLNAGEVTLRTVARLSEQLRRYLDDQAWFENRRIMTIIRDLEQHALALRDIAPRGLFMDVDEPAPKIALPMERPLFTPPVKPHIAEQPLEDGGADVSVDALFDRVHVDKDRLRARLRQALQTRDQVSLEELLDVHPLEQGLAELVAWLSIATGDGCAAIDEACSQTVSWTDPSGRERCATLPSVVFAYAQTELGG